MCQIRRGKREETIDFRQMDGETGTFKMKFLYIVYIIRDTDTILNQLQVIPVSVRYKMIVQQNCIVYLFIILKLHIMEEHHQLIINIEQIKT